MQSNRGIKENSEDDWVEMVPLTSTEYRFRRCWKRSLELASKSEFKHVNSGGDSTKVAAETGSVSKIIRIVGHKYTRRGQKAPKPRILSRNNGAKAEGPV